MVEPVRQQIIISGIGGQGVLFVTRLLAEAAIGKGLPVFTSETHGMAQRGGTVLSHLKVGGFSSPLIRPLQANGLLVLKAENVLQHGAFLKSGGWAVVNGRSDAMPQTNISADTIDADTLAQKIANPKSINLIVLGFALAKAEQTPEHQDSLFCSFEDIKAVLESRFSKNKELLDASLKALHAGFSAEGAE
ncbi:MAG: indolepyruvate oxidoreductase subunit beta [Desulfobacterales bacterium]|nr:MAG: indolepyruvate oxidoreductase subunit beta [Desulfobacterales bacterium]